MRDGGGLRGALALKALDEFRHPPQAPPPQVRRQLPPRLGEEISRLHDTVLEAVRDHVERGLDPDFFWPRDNEERLRSLMEGGNIDGAREFLREALRVLETTPAVSAEKDP